MALKLGELLLQEKMITREQLDEGLKNQVIYGTRLGSILVQMGCVETEDLTSLLSRKLGVPSIARRELNGIAPEIVNSFPRAMVERYRVVPLRREGNRLSLVMSDPTDLKAIEEISFITGYIIKPFIAADVDISRALKKYYELSSGSLRYEILAEKHRPKETHESAEAATITMPGYTETGELLQMTIPAEFEGFASLSNETSETETLFAEDGAIRYTIDRLSLDFASAQTRDDVANVFITYLGQEFKTGALFIIRGNSATGWRAISNREQIPQFRDASILLSKPSVLRDVMESRTFAMGTLISTAENRQILSLLKMSPDKPILTIPLIMLNKIVAVVMVSADMDALSKRLTELQKLVRKASLAFEMLIIRNKILMT